MLEISKMKLLPLPVLEGLREKVAFSSSRIGPLGRSWICGRRAYLMGARKVKEMQVVLETLPEKDMRKEWHPRSPICIFQ